MHQGNLSFPEKIDVSKLRAINPNPDKTTKTVREVVHQWLLDHIGHEIIGKDLEECDPRHSSSGDRIMRYLRAEGWCWVPCIARSKSRLFVEWVVKRDGIVVRSSITAEEYVNQKKAAGKKYCLEDRR